MEGGTVDFASWARVWHLRSLRVANAGMESAVETAVRLAGVLKRQGRPRSAALGSGNERRSRCLD